MALHVRLSSNRSTVTLNEILYFFRPKETKLFKVFHFHICGFRSFIKPFRTLVLSVMSRFQIRQLTQIFFQRGTTLKTLLETLVDSGLYENSYGCVSQLLYSLDQVVFQVLMMFVLSLISRYLSSRRSLVSCTQFHHVMLFQIVLFFYL